MEPLISSDALTFDGDHLCKSPHVFLRFLAYKAK
jgi:hypothetical protein